MSPSMNASIIAVLANGEVRAANLSTLLNNIPPDLAQNAMAVELSGTGNVYAIDRNGVPYAWGSTSDRDDSSRDYTNLPGFLYSPLLQVALGRAHGIALRSDGTVRGWGDDTHGQANGLNGVTNAIAVSADADYSVAVLADGSVVGAGNNTHNQLTGLDSFSDIIDCEAGETHLLLLRRDGTVTGSGNDADERISGLSHLRGVLDIEAGYDHSIARLVDHKIFCAGNNDMGQCDIPDTLTNAVYTGASDDHLINDPTYYRRVRIHDIAAGYKTSAVTYLDMYEVLYGYLVQGDVKLNLGGEGLPASLYLWGAHNEQLYTEDEGQSV